MKDQRQRPIPVEHVQINGLPCLDPANQPDNGGHGRQAGEKGQYPLSPCGTELCDKNLERGAQ